MPGTSPFFIVSRAFVISVNVVHIVIDPPSPVCILQTENCCISIFNVIYDITTFVAYKSVHFVKALTIH